MSSKSDLVLDLSEEKYDTAKFGFWIYLVSDLMIFGALFATYMILRGGTAGGPSANDLFSAEYVLLQTMALLASSFTVAMALASYKAKDINKSYQYLVATLLFGLAFLSLEVFEFSNLVSDGHDWTHGAFLSSFFALVGTHGLHISIGLTWLVALLWVMRKRRQYSPSLYRKLTLFTLFWHFLDLVWIWIFTVVYLFGVAGI